MFAYVVIRLIIILIYAAVKKGTDTTVKPWFDLCDDEGLGDLTYSAKVSSGLLAIFTFTTLKID